MQAKTQNATDAVTQCKEEYIQRRERRHHWRDKGNYSGKMPMLILDSGSVHNSDAARSFGCCSPLSKTTEQQTSSILSVLKPPKELEDCFVSNFCAQSSA